MKMLSPENKSQSLPCPLVAPEDAVGLAPPASVVIEEVDGEGAVLVEPPFSVLEVIDADAEVEVKELVYRCCCC